MALLCASMVITYHSKTSEQWTPTGLKKLSVIMRCPLLGGSLTKIATYGTKHFVRYSRHVRYFGCPLLGGFTVYQFSPHGDRQTVF